MTADARGACVSRWSCSQWTAGPRRTARRCVHMTDRLSALDVSFLYMEEPTTPMHVGGVAVFEPPPEGFDYDRLVELIEDRIALVPRYRQKIKLGARDTWPTRSGWTTPTSTSPSTCAARRCRGPGSDAQLRELVGRLHVAGGWTATGRSGRCTWSRAWRRPVRDHHQDPPRDGRRRQRGRHRPGDSRRHRRAPRDVPADDCGCRRRRPALIGLVAARSPTLSAARPRVARHGADRLLDLRNDGRQGGRRGGGLARGRAGRRPAGTGDAAERADRRAAPLRHRADRPRRLQAGAQGARRHGQRRGAGDGGRCAAGLAADPWRGGHARRRRVRAMVPVSRARRDAARRRARQPGLLLPGRPAGREPTRSCGCTRSATR